MVLAIVTFVLTDGVYRRGTGTFGRWGFVALRLEGSQNKAQCLVALVSDYCSTFGRVARHASGANRQSFGR